MWEALRPSEKLQETENTLRAADAYFCSRCSIGPTVLNRRLTNELDTTIPPCNTTSVRRAKGDMSMRLIAPWACMPVMADGQPRGRKGKAVVQPRTVVLPPGTDIVAARWLPEVGLWRAEANGGLHDSDLQPQCDPPLSKSPNAHASTGETSRVMYAPRTIAVRVTPELDELVRNEAIKRKEPVSRVIARHLRTAYGIKEEKKSKK